MNITKFEEKVVEIIENSNLFKDYKKCSSKNPLTRDADCNTPYNRSRYYYYLHTDEIRKFMQFSLYGETPFNFNVSAKTYDELFSTTLKVLKCYITSVNKSKEETSEEGKGE